MSGVRKCQSCLGEGQQMQLNSAFMGDGYRRERCGICAGLGESSFPAVPGQVAWQKQARIRDAAIRQHLKRHPGADYLELGRVAMNPLPTPVEPEQETRA